MNVVIGPNASGKSNLMRCLDMISYSAEGWLGEYVQDSGGMGALVWDGSDKAIEFSMDMIADNVQHHDALRYELVMGKLGMGASFRIEKEILRFF